MDRQPIGPEPRTWRNQIVLVRHGQTEWSLADQHTGRTDIPLTARGEQEATLVGPTLAGWQFAHTFSSPLQRARLTAERSGLAEPITLLDDLLEWDYGIYEGRRTVDIVVDEPGWSKWSGPVPDGEEVTQWVIVPIGPSMWWLVRARTAPWPYSPTDISLRFSSLAGSVSRLSRGNVSFSTPPRSRCWA